jgi:uncharacterized OsmC-like protein
MPDEIERGVREVNKLKGRGKPSPLQMVGVGVAACPTLAKGNQNDRPYPFTLPAIRPRTK